MHISIRRLIATVLLVALFATVFGGVCVVAQEGTEPGESRDDGSGDGILANAPIRIDALGDELLTVNGREYRGDIEIGVGDGELLVVNVVDIEDYVAGLDIARSGWPAAALEAQAIAARTGATREIAERDAPPETGVPDVCGGSVCSAYAGVAAETEEWTDAVKATNAQIYSGLEPERNTLGEPVRVRIATDGNVTVSAPLGFSVEEPNGALLVESGLLDWQVQAVDDDTVSLIAPAGYGTPLAIMGFSGPLRVDAVEVTHVEFTLSAPALVSIQAEAVDAPPDTDEPVVVGGDNQALGAGQHQMGLEMSDSGIYRVRVRADDGTETVYSETLDIEVRATSVGPTLLGGFALAVMLLLLVAGAYTYRVNRRGTRRRSGIAAKRAGTSERHEQASAVR